MNAALSISKFTTLTAGLGGLCLLIAAGCSGESSTDDSTSGNAPVRSQHLPIPDETTRPQNAGIATFAAGCFWCVEEVFHQVDGVTAAVSGYMGGTAADANYDDVSMGRTNHAESVQVTFDKDKISFTELVRAFYELHDPTQVDGQGPDHGRQYRSAIFYHDEEQKQSALTLQQQLKASGKHGKPIATEIVPAKEFFPAEDYHQNYARLHPDDRYIQAILVPKLKKLNLIVPK